MTRYKLKQLYFIFVNHIFVDSKNDAFVNASRQRREIFFEITAGA
jgi:hypothetical protein